MRYHRLDTIRGITLISMILYHGTWDLVYLCGMDWKWFATPIAYAWQQSICWTFILLSGFCWSMGRRKLRRGLIVLGASILVTWVTVTFLYEDRIVFGVLTFLGSAMILMIAFEKVLKYVPPFAGIVISFGAFFLLRNVNVHTFGFESLKFGLVPGGFYRNLITAYLGFQPKGFHSTDYFSLIPWIFLFVTGYFLYRICSQRDLLRIFALRSQNKDRIAKFHPVNFLGRKSIWVYLLHQPILYGLCVLIFRI